MTFAGIGIKRIRKRAVFTQSCSDLFLHWPEWCVTPYSRIFHLNHNSVTVEERGDSPREIHDNLQQVAGGSSYVKPGKNITWLKQFPWCLIKLVRLFETYQICSWISKLSKHSTILHIVTEWSFLIGTDPTKNATGLVRITLNTCKDDSRLTENDSTQ